MNTTEPTTEHKDCGNVQCKQVHSLLDALIAGFGHMANQHDASVSKALQVSGYIKELKDERDAALAKCAEMSGILEDFKPICSEDPEDMARINHALSSDCGKGWVPIERIKPLVEALIRCMDRLDSIQYAGTLKVAEQVLAEWKKITDSQTTFANAVDKPPSAV